MANEITISTQLVVNNVNLQYQASQTMRANQSVANGPSPGALKVTTGGVTVSLAQLTLGGIVQIINLDPTNYVSWGLLDGGNFRPIGELLPGEFATFRLSRSVLTANAAADVIRLVANTATCNVQFNCFDS